MSVCSVERIEAAGPDGYTDAVNDLRREAREAARAMGFADGDCAPEGQGSYGDMAILLFTMGTHVLHLLPAEIEAFRQISEGIGMDAPFAISESWPPQD